MTSFVERVKGGERKGEQKGKGRKGKEPFEGEDGRRKRGPSQEC